MSPSALRADLNSISDKKRAIGLQRFFKTGAGQYGHGDIFLGITVPQSREIVQRYSDLPLKAIETLLKSKIHEERLIALLILVWQFQKGDEQKRKQIYKFYLANTSNINNWDLVDSSADKIVGQYLWDHPEEQPVLKKLAKSDSLWERRIAIISTFQFIKRGEAKQTWQITTLLLKDKHDLIHKAAGWMLREAGKKVSRKELIKFLDRYAVEMPRTMLRYSIEHFPKKTRKKYLDK